ncbi:MAG TPA: tetratricopeptide repeat protein [Bryobacteraceae bacterium]|nr:tetratricopeptide repeat protein [Bryobacteraceae bacterium]
MKKRKGAAAGASGRAKPVDAQTAPASPAAPSQALLAVLCGLLAVAALAVYAQTATHGYVAYDDDQYVYENPWVKAGLTASNVAWAFGTFFYANWHPLTWISYMLDFSLFGANPGAEHLVNLGLHLASTLLLFWALYRMTLRPWRCAVVAAIFAVHPLHVESVAWISERKDVLSTFFEMLTLLLYIRYTARPGGRNYAAMAGAYALSLLAKPMAVTFPLVLLLLDYWPLGRMEWPPEAARVRRLALEKAPLMGMAAIAAVLTFLAQRGYGAMVSLTRLPLAARAANAAIAYVAYMGKAFWPAGLAVLYPATPPEAGATLGAVAILVVLTAAAWRWRKQRPYLAVGWLWYLGMLVPVIGLVQVGVQAMADRYTYVPLVGLSLALVWLAADLVEPHPALRTAAAATAVAALVALAGAAYRQTAYWKDSRTLFEHTLAVTRNNHLIQNNLGVIVARDGDSARAVALYRAALATAPDYAEARANLGHELVKSGHLDEALPNLQKAVQLNPKLAVAHGDLGLLLAARGRYEEARGEIERSLSLAPDDAENQSNLCYVLTHLGHAEEAIPHCQAALRINPGLANARLNLDNATAALGRHAQ